MAKDTVPNRCTKDPPKKTRSNQSEQISSGHILYLLNRSPRQRVQARGDLSELHPRICVVSESGSGHGGGGQARWRKGAKVNET